jgi:hypothetical protein
MDAPVSQNSSQCSKYGVYPRRPAFSPRQGRGLALLPGLGVGNVLYSREITVQYNTPIGPVLKNFVSRSDLSKLKVSTDCPVIDNSRMIIQPPGSDAKSSP